MTREEFVRNIRIAVEKHARHGVKELLQSPPGRTPAHTLLELSSWYSSLPSEDQDRIENIIQLTATQTIYNFLLILDGLSAFDDSDSKGELELIYVRGNQRILLNEFDDESLSSIFKDVEVE